MSEHESEDEDGLTFDESSERSWRVYLRDFKENVWPVFQEYGFTQIETAFQCWLLNRLSNDIAKLLDKLGDAE